MPDAYCCWVATSKGVACDSCLDWFYIKCASLKKHSKRNGYVEHPVMCNILFPHTYVMFWS